MAWLFGTVVIRIGNLSIWHGSYYFNDLSRKRADYSPVSTIGVLSLLKMRITANTLRIS
jgi:hypothetical protein